MSSSTAVLRPIHASQRRAVVCSLVTIALLSSLGCNKARRKDYPTISATSPDGGNVNVKGTYNHCPFVLFFASPEHAPVGHPITLTASASDQDGDTLSYVWTASGGTFSSTDSSSATFRCTMNGAVTIKLTVSDASCSTSSSGPIICQPADGGAPDGPSGTAGQSGTGGQSGAAGQSGTAGTGGSTGAAGRGGIGGSTGPGSGGTTGSAGSAGSAGTTGGGTGTGGTGGGGACVETDPPAEIAAACTECLNANDNPATDGCCQISDAIGLQLCQAVSACVRAKMCIDGADVTPCHCGTRQATCENAGEANGPCVAQFTAAAGRNITTKTTDSPNPAQVLARQGDPNYAVGRAANIYGIAGGFCPIECGVGM
jgi:hypothetical protein